jgi:hypothetical protein
LNLYMYMCLNILLNFRNLQWEDLVCASEQANYICE